MPFPSPGDLTKAGIKPECHALQADSLPSEPPGSKKSEAHFLIMFVLSAHIAWEYQAASKSLQSCPTLCDPMGCSLPGSSVHGIFQATVLEWIAISFSRGSSQSRDRTQVSRIAGRHNDLLGLQGDPTSPS